MTLCRGAEYEQTPESGPSKPNRTRSLMPSEYTKYPHDTGSSFMTALPCPATAAPFVCSTRVATLSNPDRASRQPVEPVAPLPSFFSQSFAEDPSRRLRPASPVPRLSRRRIGPPHITHSLLPVDRQPTLPPLPPSSPPNSPLLFSFFFCLLRVEMVSCPGLGNGTLDAGFRCHIQETSKALP